MSERNRERGERQTKQSDKKIESESEEKKEREGKERGTYLNSSGTDNKCCIIDVSVDEVQANLSFSPTHALLLQQQWTFTFDNIYVEGVCTKF